MERTTGGRMPYVKGTKPSIKNSVLLLSTGSPALDFIIGGGMPIGSILMIEEDLSNVYASQLLRYFITEGVVVGNDLLMGSDLHTCEKIMESLPAPCEASSSTLPINAEEMRIAWRYENLPQVQTAVDAGGKQFGHNFDLATKLPWDSFKTSHIHKFELMEAIRANAAATGRLLDKLREAFAPGYHSTSAKECRLLRICLENFGSPLWGEPADTLKTLRQIKMVSQVSLAACVITVPTHLLDDYTLSRFRAAADFVIRLESFADSESSKKKKTNPLFADYHGLLHIDKLPCWNTLDVHIPDAYEFGFKLLRKKFTIEKLHLPPDLSEIKPEKSKTGCGTATSACSSVDF